jgi:hypothetical protein
MEMKHIVDTDALFLNLISITHQTIRFEYLRVLTMIVQVNELTLQ